MNTWKVAKHQRWYEKLLSDPERLAEFRAKTRAASKARYHAERKSAESVERHRATRRKAGVKQWQRIKSDPDALAKRRVSVNKRCVNLEDAYVAERLGIESCPRALIELKRAHLKLQRELRCHTKAESKS